MTNESGRLCSEDEEIVLIDKNDKTNYTVLNDLSADESHASSQQNLSYAEVLSTGDHNDLSLPAANVSENVDS